MSKNGQKSLHILGRTFQYELNEQGCHICTSHKSSNGGYPQTKHNRKTVSIHRFIYEALRGRTLTDIVLRHSCDNKQCINPKHLKPGTHADNVKDRVLRGRTATGEQNGRAKLNENSVKVILNSSLAQKDLADIFGVDPKVIYDIRRRNTWRHVTT